jgi:hypothetical protein
MGGAAAGGQYADGWQATAKSQPTLLQDFEAAVEAGRDRRSW